MRKSKAAAAQAADEQRVSREQAALRWTDDSDVAPDVPPPSDWDALTTGYVFNAHARRVDVACSSSISHAIGRVDRVTSQRPIALYSTRSRALRALRVALEHEFAAALTRVDAWIIDEESDDDGPATD